MLGIGTKSAKIIATAALAVGIGCVGMPTPSEAGDYRRHRFHGHHHGHHNHHRHHAYRHHHRHWRSGFAVHIWSFYPPPPVPRYYPAVRPCHPVIGNGFDRFGRRAKFGGTMCYDRYGNGYVVAGSRHVIHYF